MKELTLDQVRGLAEYKKAQIRLEGNHKQVDIILAEIEELLKARLAVSHNFEVAVVNIKQIIKIFKNKTEVV